jgi:hypothetical protein
VEFLGGQISLRDTTIVILGSQPLYGVLHGGVIIIRQASLREQGQQSMGGGAPELFGPLELSPAVK